MQSVTLRRSALPAKRLLLLVALTALGAMLAACRPPARAASALVATSTSVQQTTSSPVAQATPAGLATIVFDASSGRETPLRVQVLAKDPERSIGLAGIDSLPDDEGALFSFEDLVPNHDVVIPFWMQDTLIPLSIAFLSADGRVLEEQDMAPQSTALHTPAQPYRFAVEVNQGWFARHGIQPGDSVDLSAIAGALLAPGS